jgi:sarcosine oxidase/L-pipecolate oxidase
MSELTHNSPILIVGGGTWGCSISLELARRGYQDVTVLDAHPIPAPISAGNDLNKIIEEGVFENFQLKNIAKDVFRLAIGLGLG